MEKIRLYIWIALAAVLYVGYMTWQQDYPSTPPTVAATSLPSPATSTLPDLPGALPISTNTAAPPASTPNMAAVNPAAPSATPAERITVRTDVLDITISLQGGDLERSDLLNYPASKDSKDKYVRLFDTNPESYFVGHSGLRAVDDRAAPTHQAHFTAAANQFVLADAQDTLVVPLTWTNDDGIQVVKTYTFHRGSYAIALDYQVTNSSDKPWEAASYVQFARKQPYVETSIFEAESFAFIGPAIYDGKEKRNLKLTDDDNKSFKGNFTGGWIAAMQHHFVAAAVPKADATYDYTLDIETPQQFKAMYRGPLVNVAPKSSGTIHETLFVGPKLQSQLEPIGSKVHLTVDYGWLTILAGPLFWLLAKGHSLLGNWGWSIIAVTLLIKLAFYKLTEASGKSMAKMREMAPRLKALQERYKDDREQLGRATMEFYKREKINPVAGCLPMLIQMPVFMAFYWAILNSAEMRQAPFIGYLTDLSSRDPYFILPLLLGVANFMQFKLNPAPTDPMQAKVMMMMPIVMTGMMVLFPSGLVLYWITNTGLSILQQWHINKVVAAAEKAKNC